MAEAVAVLNEAVRLRCSSINGNLMADKALSLPK